MLHAWWLIDHDAQKASIATYIRYSSIITSHTRGTPQMVNHRFSHVKFKKLPCELFPRDETCHFPEMTCGICSRHVITQDMAVEVPISRIIQNQWLHISVQPTTEVTYTRYRPTTTSHMHYTTHVKHACFSMEKEIIMHAPLNSHGFAKPHVIATQTGFTCVPHILGMSVKTSSWPYEVTQVKAPDWWVACVWLYLCLSFIYEICILLFFWYKLTWFLASFWLRFTHKPIS